MGKEKKRMKKGSQRFLSLAAVLVVTAASCLTSAAVPAFNKTRSEADTVWLQSDICPGNRLGTVNGEGACVNDAGDLHVCDKNFPDANYRDFLQEAISAEYFTADMLADVTSMPVSSMEIASLAGVEYFFNLTSLFCDYNQLTQLDVSHNPALRILSCSENQLTELDVSSNPALENLTCPANKISKLDLHNNPKLTLLYCYRNALSALDLEKNPLLTIDNSIIVNQTVQAAYAPSDSGWTLDMTHLVSSENLHRISNVSQGTYDASTGMVTLQYPPELLTYDYSTGLEGLTLTVKVTPYESDAGEIDGSFNGLPACVNGKGELHICEKNFPDAHFRSCLLEQIGGEDGYISYGEASASFTNLFVSEREIHSLEGIQYFSDLDYLSCSGNQLTELDVSGNPALRILSCHSNQLTRLDVSGNPLLENLDCAANKITKLDLHNNPKLVSLYCYRNEIGTLDLENNPLLTADNSIISAQSPRMSYIPVEDGWALDLSTLVPIGKFDRIVSMSKGDLDPQTGIVTLHEPTSLFIYDYRTGREGLDLHVQIDVQEGQTGEIDGSFNGLPACVNDKGDLHICEKNFPDAHFRAYLLEQDTEKAGCFSRTEAASLVAINVSGREIQSMQGIGFFSGVNDLDCSQNRLTSLDISKNPALTKLYCHNNQLSELDVVSNATLRELSCSNNQLSELDVSANQKLAWLDCSGNRLAALNTSGSPDLGKDSIVSPQAVITAGWQADGKWMVDLSGLLPAEMLGRVLSVSEGVYDAATGKVYFEKETATFFYTIATGNESLNMTVTVTVENSASVVKGDLDKDGKVTIADVMEACKVLARKSADLDPTTDEIARGDLDNDGDVTIADVMEICKVLARKG